MRDKLGQEVKSGDRIAYASRRGNAAQLGIYKVVDVFEDDVVALREDGLVRGHSRLPQVSTHGVKL